MGKTPPLRPQKFTENLRKLSNFLYNIYIHDLWVNYKLFQIYIIIINLNFQLWLQQDQHQALHLPPAGIQSSLPPAPPTPLLIPPPGRPTTLLTSPGHSRGGASAVRTEWRLSQPISPARIRMWVRGRTSPLCLVLSKRVRAENTFLCFLLFGNLCSTCTWMSLIN